MATIRKEFRIDAPIAKVWEALGDFGALHTKLARGFVADTKLEQGGAVRLVTFANGMQVREWLVTRDDAAMRLVYAICDSPRYQHYSASAQVFAELGGGSRFVWQVDFLPDDMTPMQNAAMEAGVTAMRATLGEG